MIRGIVRKLKKSRMRWGLLGIVAIFMILAIDYVVYPHLTCSVGTSGNTGGNGLWVKSSWYLGNWNDADLDGLARRLQSGQMRYVYCHTRFIDSDGYLFSRCPESAQRLVKGLRTKAPTVKVIAWVFAGNNRIPYHPIDLSSSIVRKRMVAEAVWLTTVCGFDGIQWDYEICSNGDKDLLSLLRETRAALPKGKLLSVCTGLWYPRPFVGTYGWDEGYFEKVSAVCDQLVVMGYDSAIYLPRTYVWLICQQTARVSQAVSRGNSQCKVLIGIPTYEKGGLSHHAYAENIRMALKGVREGIADTPRASFEGVALFADYTTSSSEWKDYRDLWLEK